MQGLDELTDECRRLVDPEDADLIRGGQEAFVTKLAAARLTNRQRRFVLAYIKQPFGARAARNAGYSHNRARQQAYDNLRKPHIRRLIEQGLHAYFQECGIPASPIPPDACWMLPELRCKSHKRGEF